MTEGEGKEREVSRMASRSDSHIVAKLIHIEYICKVSRTTFMGGRNVKARLQAPLFFKRMVNYLIDLHEYALLQVRVCIFLDKLFRMMFLTN